MLAAQKPDPDSHRTLRPVVDPDTAWSVIALVNLAKVTHTNFRRAEKSPGWSLPQVVGWRKTLSTSCG